MRRCGETDSADATSPGAHEVSRWRGHRANLHRAIPSPGRAVAGDGRPRPASGRRGPARQPPGPRSWRSRSTAWRRRYSSASISPRAYRSASVISAGPLPAPLVAAGRSADWPCRRAAPGVLLPTLGGVGAAAPVAGGSSGGWCSHRRDDRACSPSFLHPTRTRPPLLPSSLAVSADEGGDVTLLLRQRPKTLPRRRPPTAISRRWPRQSTCCSPSSSGGGPRCPPPRGWWSTATVPTPDLVHIPHVQAPAAQRLGPGGAVQSTGQRQPHRDRASAGGEGRCYRDCPATVTPMDSSYVVQERSSLARSSCRSSRPKP